jgi:L-amino acid N-acyltransferase YncA
MRSKIRLAAERDAATIAAIYGPYVESTIISFEVQPPGEDDMRGRLAQTLPSHPWLVCEQGGEVAGFAYASPHRARAAYGWSVDTAVYIADRHHRCGIGHGLYVSLLAILAAQGFVNAFAGITLPNAASVGLHERVGFQPIGVYRRVGFKLGAWRDVGWWQLALAPYPAEPEAPRVMSVMQDRDDWESLLTRGLDMIRTQPT